jgi:hypothetical protein
MLLTRVVSGTRGSSLALLVQIWALVAAYAVLHDQYLIRIAPEHFTVYHRPLAGIQNLTALAAAWALLASLAPGLLLGIGCLVAARAGPWPTLRSAAILTSVTIVLLATELCSATAGGVVFVSGHGIYPASFYVAGTVSLLVTQTIQITCYSAGALLSCAMLLRFVALRKHAARHPGPRCGHPPSSRN